MTIHSQLPKRRASIVKSDGSSVRLNRIPFMSGSFNEAWLQQILADNPELIPSDEVGSEFFPLVCIGREVPVGSGETQGYIDNLYLSPSGNIVVVETKLFRNQEARRTVVAQVIDYAKELQKWDCEQLNKIASDYYFKTEGQAFNLIDLIARKGYLTLSDEASLTDNINRNLSSASFLLMIVGDGIRTGVQQLAEFLNDNLSMSFRLALAEMEVYQNRSETIVIPNLLTKASVIERQTSNFGINSFSGSSPQQPSGKPYIRKPVLSRREFISTFADNGGYDEDEITEFICDLEAINGLTVEIAPTELTIRFSPESGKTYALMTFCIAQNHADLWVMPGRIKAALERSGIFPFEANDFLEFFKKFVDRSRCKTEPYENEAGFYYARIDDVLHYSQDFISAAEQFVLAISK